MVVVAVVEVVVVVVVVVSSPKMLLMCSSPSSASIKLGGGKGIQSMERGHRYRCPPIFTLRAS